MKKVAAFLISISITLSVFGQYKPNAYSTNNQADADTYMLNSVSNNLSTELTAVDIAAAGGALTAGTNNFTGPNSFTGGGNSFSGKVNNSVNTINKGGFYNLSGFIGTNSTAALSQQKPCFWILAGDSVMDYQTTDLIAILGQKNQLSGYGMTAKTVTGNSSLTTGDFGTYITGDYSTVTNGSVRFDINGTGAGLFGDHIALYYIQETNAGTFNIFANVDAGSYPAAPNCTNINANIAGNQKYLAVTNFSVTRGIITVSNVANSGSVKLVACIVYDSLHPGIVLYQMSKGGIDFTNQFAACSNSILQSIGSSVNPSLIWYKEMSDSNQWATLAPLVISNLFMGATNCDLLLQTPNPTGVYDTLPLLYGEGLVQRNLALTATNWLPAHSPSVVLWDGFMFWGSWFNVTNCGASDNTRSPHLYDTGIFKELASVFDETGLGEILDNTYNKGRNSRVAVNDMNGDGDVGWDWTSTGGSHTFKTSAKRGVAQQWNITASDGTVLFSLYADSGSPFGVYYLKGWGGNNEMSFDLNNSLVTCYENFTANAYITSLLGFRGNGSGITNIPPSGISSGTGTPVAVTVGASPFSFTNTTGARLECSISGTIAYSVTKNAAAIYGSLAGDCYACLQTNASIVITYGTAPTLFTNSW